MSFAWLLCVVFVAAWAQEITEDVDFAQPELEVTLTDEDFAQGEELDRANISSISPRNETGAETDPIEKAGLFEGDIAGVDNETVDAWIAEGKGLISRNAVRNKYGLWPRGQVPYTISGYFGRYARGLIASAMAEYHKKTCIKFTPRTSERNYVYIYPNGGCHSMVGKVGGRQMLSLGSNCVQKGIIIHEMMHAVGFWHEQSRADRDQYVRINKHNVMPKQLYNFKSYGLDKITHLGTAYDYGSIMHYGAYAFGKYGARRGYETITALKPGGQSKMGNRKGFSPNDIYKINKLYSCKNTGTKPNPEPETTPAPVESRCYDQLRDCWNRKRYNYCSYDRYTRYYCRKTCGFCTATARTTAPTVVTQAPCVNRNSRGNCESWAAYGYCSTYKSFMRANCRKACDLCGTPGTTPDGATTTAGIRTTPTVQTTTTTTTGTSCKDHHDRCQKWADDLEVNNCAKYKDYLITKCPKACRFC